MRIAYFTANRINRNSGVPAKLGYQLDGWQRAGHEAQLFCATDEADIGDRVVDGTIVQRQRKRNPLTQLLSDRRTFRELGDKLRAWEPDVVYIRWGYHRRIYCQLADQFPAVVELNGDVLRTAYRAGRDGRNRLVNRLLGPYTKLTIDRLLSRARGIVCVTNEVSRLDYVTRQGKPLLVLPNSIDLRTYKPLPPSDPAQGIPRAVFIGNVASWHGLDKIATLARRTAGKLEIDVIGCDCPWPECPPNVTFHGFLDKAQFLKVFESCDVGLDGLSLHTKDMQEACPLKIREYLACGLPIVLACEDTAFIGVEQPEWVLKIGNDPGNIERSADAIAEFASRMKGRRLEHDEVAEYIDSGVLEAKRAAFMQSIL